MGTVLHRCNNAQQPVIDSDVSVPFSMGTVLHLFSAVAVYQGVESFQSPSRWGRCCIGGVEMPAGTRLQCFSPLLDGDGVASS